MFSQALSQSLLELFANSLLRFAEKNRDIVEPPKSLDEALQHGAQSGKAAPFHFALFPEIIRLKTLERSFSSALGNTHEEAAFLIGREHFGYAERQHVVKGRIRSAAISQIDQILKDYESFVTGRRGGRVGVADAIAERALLDSLIGPGGDDFQERVDLFLRGPDGAEHYFHMKTVKPNRDQSNKAKRLLLRVHALRRPANVHTFFGMAYNPYGEGNPYKWTFPKPYFDFANEVLIGGQFWDYAGGPDTFRELLRIAIAAGLEVHDQLIRELGIA